MVNASGDEGQARMKRKTKAERRAKIMFRALNFGSPFYLDRIDVVPVTKVKPHLHAGNNCIRPDGSGAFIDPKNAVYVPLADYKRAEKQVAV